MKVYIFLAEGFEEIEAVSVIDTLKRARIDIKSVSITNNTEVTGRSRIRITADMTFDKAHLEDAEMLVLPGGMPGAANLGMHKELGLLLSEYNEKGKNIAAICAGPTVFGKLGLLKNKKATSYPGLENELIGALISSDNVVYDKNITTSRGPGTAIEFSLKLIEILAGKEICEKVRSGMLA